MKKSQENWLEKYHQMKLYIEENRHLPDKRKVENRGLLNWWKYNRKMEKAGKLSPYYAELLRLLSDMRHTSPDRQEEIRCTELMSTDD